MPLRSPVRSILIAISTRRVCAPAPYACVLVIHRNNYPKGGRPSEYLQLMPGRFHGPIPVGGQSTNLLPTPQRWQTILGSPVLYKSPAATSQPAPPPPIRRNQNTNSPSHKSESYGTPLATPRNLSMRSQMRHINHRERTVKMSPTQKLSAHSRLLSFRPSTESHVPESHY